MQRFITLAPLLVVACLTSAPAAHAQWGSGWLSAPRQAATAVTAGNFAIIAGGRNANTVSGAVDVYDSTTGAWTTHALSLPRVKPVGATVGNLTMFAGGATSLPTVSGVIDVYDASIGVPSDPLAWSTALLPTPRSGFAATTLGTKVFFAGGSLGGTPPVLTNVVDIYDSALGLPNNPAAWSTATLSVPRAGLAAATAGNFALFAGGGDLGGMWATVDIYDDSTGLWSQTTLSQARHFGTTEGVSVSGTLAIFAGGQIVGNPAVMSDRVDIYDSALGLPTNPLAWSRQTLSTARTSVAVTVLGNTVMFGGGLMAGSPVVPSAALDVYNVGTGRMQATLLPSGPCNEMAATTVGGKSLFAGGSTAGAASANVEIYEPVGVNYCVATANSSGQAATISASGSASLAANNFELTATGLPNNRPFLFLHGATQAQLPFGNGYLCVGTGVGRIQPGGSAAGGVAQTLVNLPAAGITAPGVRNFQCWFRDAAAGGAFTNTSDAIEVTFVP